MVRRDQPTLSCRATDGMVVTDHHLLFFYKEEVMTRVQEFLKKSRLFSSNDVTLEIYLMDFPFRSGTIWFENIKNTEKDFSRQIRYIIKQYMENCRDQIINKPSQKEKAIERLWDGIFSFAEKFDPEDILEKISSGENFIDIPIDINNSVLMVKRFGNCIGINVHQKNETHQDGFKAMEMMCGKKEPILAPFIHRIECSIPIKPVHSGNNSLKVDFSKIYDQVLKECRFINWEDIEVWFLSLIDNYVNTNLYRSVESGVIIGSREEVQIHARIINTDTERCEYQKEVQWRKGNVSISSEKPFCCDFSDGNLRLLLMAHSGLPRYNRFGNFNTTVDIAQKQYHLDLVSSALFTQLCCVSQFEQIDKVYTFM